ncbi:MAG: molybdopterin-binding protein [Desulfatiglandaceae bacterium]
MTNKVSGSVEMISIENAAGTILAHDVTEIRAGDFKGAAFKKGYVIKSEDIEHLKRLGKEHLFVLKPGPDDVHEDDAASSLAAALSGPGVIYSDTPVEGKLTLQAAYKGLLKIDTDSLTKLCSIPEICCATRHTNTVVERSDAVAATRAIPLLIDRHVLDRAVAIAGVGDGILRVEPFSTLKAGIVVTGNEVYSGRIKDKFGAVLTKKLEAFGCEVMEPVLSPDDSKVIRKCIEDLLAGGAGLILVAAGMSVDPDDVSRQGIAEAGAVDIVYGTSILPGAMFLSGRIGEVPILGVPACALYYRATALDLILPRVLAGEKITRLDIAKLAHGGLCLNCEHCRYPICPFGK